MKKLKKLQLTKETVANLSGNEMHNLKGAGNDELVENPHLLDSRVSCMTYFETGGCTTSKSCKALICIPF
ncbi:MAG: class I lanthipeptide [Porphyromonadaceae bacterium]|nr:class I lanthipeptide [Porphyromonadaceae bacterium]